MIKTDIPLARPNITQAEIDAVTAVLQTPILSLGPKLREFEESFAAYVGSQHGVAVSSGTAGLHLVVRALGIGSGDEVICPPFTFIATSNVVLMEGAKPVFVDIDPHTWNIDPAAIERAITPETRGVIPVDVFGTTPDMDAIAAIARQHELAIIEDSCEALGTKYKGEMAGKLGDAGVFGFYPNKQMTTGEGGMITTDNDEIAHLCQSMRNQGRDSMGGWLAHPRMGYNYRLSDINCALGLAQVQRIEDILEPRKRIHNWYRDRLSAESRIVMQVEPADQEISWFVCVVRLADQYNEPHRDGILRALRERGIGCSNYFAPVHLQPFYVEQFGFKPGDFPVCEHVAARSIALPFHHELSAADVDTVCTTLCEELDRIDAAGV